VPVTGTGNRYRYLYGTTGCIILLTSSYEVYVYYYVCTGFDSDVIKVRVPSHYDVIFIFFYVRKCTVYSSMIDQNKDAPFHLYLIFIWTVFALMP
jgi:hypothetical protein